MTASTEAFARGYDRVPVRAAATLPAMRTLTVAHLHEVTQPPLVYRSAVDHVVGPNSMKALRQALPEVEVRPLGNSYHVATLDNDAPAIFDGTLAWINQHAALAGGQHQGQTKNRA
jgi:carboxylesterase